MNGTYRRCWSLVQGRPRREARHGNIPELNYTGSLSKPKQTTSAYLFLVGLSVTLTVKKRQNAGHTYPADLTRGLQREERAIDHRPTEAKHRPVMVPLATGNANGPIFIIRGGASSPMIVNREQCRQEAKDPCGMSDVIVRTHIGPRQAPGEPSKTRLYAPASLVATRPNDALCLVKYRGSISHL